MGFLSAYSGTEHFDLGNGYWVELKQCLSTAEMQRAEAILTGQHVALRADSTTNARIDMAAFHNAMVSASIVSWNIDDENEQIWPLTPERAKQSSIARLPGPVFNKIWQRVNALNGSDGDEERQKFRARSERGVADGDDGAAALSDVPGPDGILETSWVDG